MMQINEGGGMYIENHGFETSIEALTDLDLEELLGILGIPAARYKTFRNYKSKTRTVTSMEYGFGKTQRSVYLRLGEYNTRTLVNQDTREYLDRRFDLKTGAPMDHGGVRYRSHVSLELKGSFFDNAANFDLSRLLAFLARTDHRPRALDVAYCDDQQVTDLQSDWLRVFRTYSTHCIGNIIKRGEIIPQEPNGVFKQVNIGNAGTRTGTYGTLYKRPDYLRLEMKYRNPDMIRGLLSHYDEHNRQSYYSACLDALITNLDIVTATSKRKADPSKYVREPFYQRFLASEPSRISVQALKEARQDLQEESQELKFAGKVKRVAGGLANLLNDFADTKTLSEMIDAMTAYAPATKQFFETDPLP